MLGGATAIWPLAAHAQQSPKPAVGFFGSMTADGFRVYLDASGSSGDM